MVLGLFLNSSFFLRPLEVNKSQTNILSLTLQSCVKFLSLLIYHFYLLWLSQNQRKMLTFFMVKKKKEKKRKSKSKKEK